MSCAICGGQYTEGAHVRAKESFEDGVDDQTWNIVTLCPSCHTEFDNGRVGISRDKTTFVILNDDGTLRTAPSQVSLAHLRNDYLDWKIQRCVLKVRLRLGSVPG